MIKIENLTKKYGNLVAVENLSLEISSGEIFGFVGPNGSGKSTTIKCILNFIKKNSGKVYINNVEFLETNITEKNNIGYLASEIKLYDDLTGKQIIEYSKKFYKSINQTKIDDLCTRLKFDTSKKFDEYSFGNRKKLGIILCLMHDPNIIIMDEATSGLDPLIQDEFYKILEEEKEKGSTIFFSSHNLTEVKRICDRVGMIKEGKLIFIEDIKKMSKFNNYLISIHLKSPLYKNQLPKNIISYDNKILKFLFDGTPNKLSEMLSNFKKIERFYVEEPSIEDLFLYYYK